MILVDAPEDGGNPRDGAAIRRLGDDHVLVAPFSEDGDANYKFALHVRARNPGPASAPLTLEVEWGDERYMPSRRFVHLRTGGEWTFLPAATEGSRTLVRCMLPPGESAVGLSPAYGWADYRAFVAGAPELATRLEVIGRSEQGRAIEAFRFGAGPRRVLVTARFHPYETAASYCVEGLLRWLGAEGEGQGDLLRRCQVVVVPLPNPDGVYLGPCKRTAPGGVDLSHEAVGSEDAAARTLLGLLDALRPDAFLDIHGWMHDDEDGLHYYDQAVADRFLALAEKRPELASDRWKGTLERSGGASPRWYAAQHFGTRALAVSYRWPGRTVVQMRALGAATLRAFPPPE